MKNTDQVEVVAGAENGVGKKLGVDSEPFPSHVFIVSPMKGKAVEQDDERSLTDESTSAVSSISDDEVVGTTMRVHKWDRKTRYSDLIQDGLRYLSRDIQDVIMLFESPSSSTKSSSFFNGQVYRFHDYPPSSSMSKSVLGPCRYSLMNGNVYPSFLKDGCPPAGLVEHWESAIPDFVAPTFVSEIPSPAHVYAYLPVESIAHHINDPHVHYHMVGKDSIRLMTNKTPNLLSNTKEKRPCIAKTTHSMGSKGIFVIKNDEDEEVFNKFLAESGNPTFVVTDFIDIERNVACHFFIHPSGEVTWFGSNENLRRKDGKFTADSHLIMKDQDALREMQLPFVKDVVQYCLSLGFWGFCGIDVLFDKDGVGYLVDVNPRVTGSCPALMVAQLLQDKYGFEYGLFRRNGKMSFHGSLEELFSRVKTYNDENLGESQIVIFGAFQEEPALTKINIGVYANTVEKCRSTLNKFAQSKKLRVPATPKVE